MSSEPIADYALLSDCRSAALVSAAGSVDWLCFPRFDSPSVFGRILGPDAGFWSVRPVGSYRATAALRRSHSGAGDHLHDPGRNAERYRRPDAWERQEGPRSRRGFARAHCCVSSPAPEGSVDVEIILRSAPGLRACPPAGNRDRRRHPVPGGRHPAVLFHPVPLRAHRDTAQARRELRAGDIAGFALSLHGRTGTGSRCGGARRRSPVGSRTRCGGWTSWSELHQNYGARGGNSSRQRTDPAGTDATTPPGPSWPRPRRPYRRCRRFAQLGLPVQLDPGREHDPAGALGRRLPGRGGKVLPIPVARGRAPAGRRGRAPDHVRRRRGTGAARTGTGPPPRLAGQRPVRVGNGAWNQRQLDVYGELLDAAATLPEYLAELEPETAGSSPTPLTRPLPAGKSADHGIWEVRGEPRHYLHSKLMCWVALDRAIDLAGLLQAADRVPQWTEATRAGLRHPSVPGME